MTFYNKRTCRFGESRDWTHLGWLEVSHIKDIFSKKENLSTQQRIDLIQRFLNLVLFWKSRSVWKLFKTFKYVKTDQRIITMHRPLAANILRPVYTGDFCCDCSCDFPFRRIWSSGAVARGARGGHGPLYCWVPLENCQCCRRLPKLSTSGGEDLKFCRPENFLVCRKIFSVCLKSTSSLWPPPQKKHGSHGATELKE